MRKISIVLLLVIPAGVLGLAAAFGVSRVLGNPLPGWIPNTSAGNTGAGPQGWNGQPGSIGPGMMGGYGGYRMGPGMMGGYAQGIPNNAGTRITMDRAIQQAENYAASSGTGLQVAEVMEFQNNFYAVVIEEGSGKAAFEILMDPFTATVFPEPGPNMMWNVKYGHMGSGASTENTISLDQAREYAQKALDSQIPGATVEEDGYSFYGYYTFDYRLNGQIAGMLSVNGFNGQTWFHTWHGSFISEKELEQ